MSSILHTSFFSSKRCRANGLETAKTKRMGGLLRHSSLARSLRIEPLEDRHLLSVAATTVGIGAPVLAVFDDPTATVGTTFSASSTNPDVTATVLHTSELLKMQVHTVNADGSTGTSGEMDFLLLDDVAPNNIAHITTLVSAGFYNTTAQNTLTFHRIIQDFMIQGGDPLTKDPTREAHWGTGGPGHEIKAEFNDRHHDRGVLSMARSQDPDSAGSQFFICHGSPRFLDRQYTAFGRLIAGDDVLEKIAMTLTRPQDRPVKRMGVESIKIVPADAVK